MFSVLFPAAKEFAALLCHVFAEGLVPRFVRHPVGEGGIHLRLFLELSSGLGEGN